MGGSAASFSSFGNAGLCGAWECPHVKSSFKNIYDFLPNLCKTQQWDKNSNFDFDEEKVNIEC